LKKYIFVTGGVASSFGKGIIAVSVAKPLQARGYSVTNQKFDPYINVNPGLLNLHPLFVNFVKARMGK
jgi:CTP synthase